MTSTMIHIRIDEDLKEDASKALAAMGLTLSDAVRVLLTKVAIEQRLPFELKVPKAPTVTSQRVDSMDDILRLLGSSNPSQK
ncbi:RelB antitoxin [Thiothrix eikelboomii]|uniref:RelB antitoxin n=1 Tax=Thiothrix eikelboomii TaxID=92487 RepID=A0A1T4Y6P0_9GAMM|nr:RelB antitoxin [Thiothrix eikelboomii]